MNTRTCSWQVGIATALLAVWGTDSLYGQRPSAPPSSESQARPSVAGPKESNSIIIGLQRQCDQELNAEYFRVFINVDLPGVTGVSNISVTTGGGFRLPNLNEGDDEINVSNLAEAKSVASGTWTIEVDGQMPSVSTFEFDATDFVDSDFFTCPTLLVPAMAGGEVVPQDVVFSWQPPASGPYPVYVVNTFLDVTTRHGISEGPSVFLDPRATSWDPREELPLGPALVGVGYYSLGSSDQVSSIQVTAGDIVWGVSFFAPRGYPDATPLVAVGGETHVPFVISESSGVTGDLNGDNVVNGADLGLLLAAWNSNDPAADLNDDGNVDGADLGLLLGAWT